MSLNQCQFIGNVGGDPEIVVMDDGRKLAKFNLATNEIWTDKQTGKQKEQTEWHRIIVWNERLIGFLENHVKKGSSLFVQGPLRHREYEKNGEKRWASEIVINWEGKISFAGGKREVGGNRPPDPESPEDGANIRTRGEPQGQAEVDLDDEIPF